VGGQVALPGSHLVELSCNKLAQPHEEPRVQGGGMVVVARGREESIPLVVLSLGRFFSFFFSFFFFVIMRSLFLRTKSLMQR